MTHPAHPLQSVLEALEKAKTLAIMWLSPELHPTKEQGFDVLISADDAITTIRAMMDVEENKGVDISHNQLSSLDAKVFDENNQCEICNSNEMNSAIWMAHQYLKQKSVGLAASGERINVPRLIEWIRNPNRCQPQMLCTESDERQIAYAVMDAIANSREHNDVIIRKTAIDNTWNNALNEAADCAIILRSRSDNFYRESDDFLRGVDVMEKEIRALQIKKDGA